MSKLQLYKLHTTFGLTSAFRPVAKTFTSAGGLCTDSLRDGPGGDGPPGPKGGRGGGEGPPRRPGAGGGGEGPPA